MIIHRSPAATAARIARDLESARSAGLASIQAAIAAVRAPFVTDLPGQEMIYQRKEAEARAWLADPAPDLAHYPFLAREIGITAPTAHELAQIWLNMAAMLTAQGSVLEGLRQSANAAVAAAASATEIDAIVATVVQQLRAGS